MDTGYFDICLSAYRKIETEWIRFSPSERILPEYSLVRLTKTGKQTGFEADWDAILAEQMSRIKAFHPGICGDTVSLTWPIHPGAVWMSIRGIADFTAETVPVMEDFIKHGHRNESGLFDDPAKPGHLSPEILAMAVPSLVWTGKCSGVEMFYEEAVRQMEGYTAALCDPKTKLWHSDCLPDGGTGYALFALSELIFDLPAGHEKKESLTRSRRDCLEALLPYQDADGMWHRTIDDRESPPDPSVTGWILYAMGRAIKQGEPDRAHFASFYIKGLAGLAGYVAHDGSIFNGSAEAGKDDPASFTPVLLAYQQAGLNEAKIGMPPSLDKILEQQEKTGDTENGK